MYMPSFRNRSWKFAALLGVLYITISNTTLFTNDLLGQSIPLKENLENLANLLSPTPKNLKEIHVSSSKSHILMNSEKYMKCSYEYCSKKEKRTYLFCSNCEKHFHRACFSECHNE